MKTFYRVIIILSAVILVSLGWYAISESNFADTILGNQGSIQHQEGFERERAGLENKEGSHEGKSGGHGSNQGVSITGLGSALAKGFVKVALPTTLMILVIAIFQWVRKKIKPKKNVAASS